MRDDDNLESSTGDHVAVLDVPITLTHRNGTVPTRTLLPTAVLRLRGEMIFPRETFDWGVSRIFKASHPVRRREMAVAARLYLCSLKYPEIDFTDETDIDQLVWTYLFHRLYSPSDIAERIFPTWDQVVYEVVVEEFRIIRAFAHFCRKLPGCDSALGLALSGNSEVFDYELPERRNDFFSHLSVQRERWKRLAGLDPVFPKDLKRFGGSTPKRSQPREMTPHPDEVRVQIDAEHNMMLKALWILLYGTGIRIAEALNLWTCDVLPSSYSVSLCGYRTHGQPLIILAHPVDSTYTGKLSPSLSQPTRRMVLRQMDPNLDARPLLHDGRRLGWKGMSEGNSERRYSWAFWNDLALAQEFESLVSSILAIHKHSGSDRRHPFFFCNPDPLTKFYGDMLRYQNAYGGWQRSCKRVGIPIGEEGIAPHSARHFWKWRSEHVLGLSRQDRQLGLHHLSIGSQDDYGLRAEALYHKLAA